MSEGGSDPHAREYLSGLTVLMYLFRQGVVGVGEVHARRGHLVELLAVPGGGSGRSTMASTSGDTHRFGLDEVPRADDLFDDTVGSGPLEVAFLRK